MDLLNIFINVLQPQYLLLILVGVVVGSIFGTIPGLNAPIAVALVLPFTFVMDVMSSMCIIMGLYMGCVSGGLVSAILLKIPGTAASVATTFDGYPMAQKGMATEALSYGAFASIFGGLFSTACLIAFAPILANMAIGFGPWEYFGTATLSLVIVCVLSADSLKAFTVALIGLLFKVVGMSPVDGVAARYTFGNYNLESGFNLVVVIIGIFALPEILNSIGELKVKAKPVKVKKRLFYVPTLKTIKENLGTMIRGSVIGTAIGILPGMGGGAASLISYAQAKKGSKHPELFGTGIAEGIFCCESANNATTGGALIPMLALGVPGDTVTAIIMGALTLQGITPGPLLSMNQPSLFKSIIVIVLIANIFMFIYQITTIRFMSKIIEIPKRYLFPLVSMFCVVGVISLNNNLFDLISLMGFMIVGYILDKNHYPLAPFVLANVLGGIIEDNMRRAIIYQRGFLNCMKVPSIGTVFFILAVLLPVFSYLLKKPEVRKALHLKNR